MRSSYLSSLYALSLCLATALLLAGCQSVQQDGNAIAQDLTHDEGGSDAQEPLAIQAAEERGIAALNCPMAEGHVLSREIVQPVVWGGISRPQFTIGVEGCGQRVSYIVVCPPNGSGCVAGDADK